MHGSLLSRTTLQVLIFLPLTLLFLCAACSDDPPSASPAGAVPETQEQYESRMQWWDEARFGLFIHWGVMSVPGGIWNGRGYPSDWIRYFAEIPRDEYRALAAQFRPSRFNATEWVRMAKDAGMRYIVITAKHHDGFSLFDSKQTDFDVMSTPFHRDVMRELAEACRKASIRICWYYSIMDWDHPDYLPRMKWETGRPPDVAEFERYVRYVKDQIRELLTEYGDISVLWFDGEWEQFWTTSHAAELLAWIRSFQPDIIVNDRIGGGRSELTGNQTQKPALGDYATQEHAIPDETPPEGKYWETCETLNTSFAYTSFDQLWKSPRDVIKYLAEAASKGGNFLLGTGPDADGVFPEPAVNCFRIVGAWLRRNGESIYGTRAGRIPAQEWGFCTRGSTGTGTRLYLHVVSWPTDGKLRIRGLISEPDRVFFLADEKRASLAVTREEDALVVRVPVIMPDPNGTVVVLEYAGPVASAVAPVILPAMRAFVNPIDVTLKASDPLMRIMYTTDGTEPTAHSAVYTTPIRIEESVTITARCYKHGAPVSPTARAVFTRLPPLPAVQPANPAPGIAYAYYEGAWRVVPDFTQYLPRRTGIAPAFGLIPPYGKDFFAFDFHGYISIPETGLYTFGTYSDDGSQLFIDGRLVVQNDSAHIERERIGSIGLAAGFHRIRAVYFEIRGEEVLDVRWQPPGQGRSGIPSDVLFHER